MLRLPLFIMSIDVNSSMLLFLFWRQPSNASFASLLLLSSTIIIVLCIRLSSNVYDTIHFQSAYTNHLSTSLFMEVYHSFWRRHLKHQVGLVHRKKHYFCLQTKKITSGSGLKHLLQHKRPFFFESSSFFFVYVIWNNRFYRINIKK